MSYVPIAMLFVALLGSGCAQCPHEATDLVNFSDNYSSDMEDVEVDITTPTLLDLADVSVKRLIVSGTGRLVFARGIDITLRAKAILVKDNGQFLIGHKDCRHEDNVNIILEGKKSSYPELAGPGGEEKYMIVQDQGVLNIHGVEKRAWTKISATLDRYEAFSDDTTLVKYDHKTSTNKATRPFARGLSIYHVNADLTIASYSVVNLFKRDKVHKEQEDVDELTEALDNIANGQLVSIAIQNFFDPAPETDLSALYDKIEDVAGMQSGELLLRNAGKFKAFALMFIKGGQYTQELDNPPQEIITEAKVSLDMGDYKVTSGSYIDPSSISKSGIAFRMLHKSIGYPTATVIHDITGWNVGDKLIITSTDYEAQHTEVRTIKQIVSPNEVMLSEELYYRHFGEIEHRVDMRAEVAILTRNIKIRGAVEDECPAVNGNCATVGYDSFGGHIKMVKSFGEVYIQGAEITQMGQLGVKGVYPLHFHMCGDISGKIAIIEGNSISYTFQRAITIHGTYSISPIQHGVLIKDNVAFHVLGHTFFTEDGSESGTIFEGNLGALTMNVDTGFFASDATEASTYWITNPQVVMTGNVAAGSQDGVGFWYIFPDEPVGASKGMRYKNGEAYRTPLWKCDNNIAHSNKRGGFQMAQKVLDGDGNVGSHFNYVPRVDPNNESSDLAKVQIVRLTAYKNKRRNAWLRGGAQFMQLSSAESEIGMAMARASTKQQQFASKMVFIGQSEKNGEEEGYPDAYTPQDAKYLQGVQFIYGPQYISQAWFTGFKPSSDGMYAAAALAFKKSSTFPVSELTSLRDIKFGFNDPSDGNRVFAGGPDDTELGFMNKDGTEIQSFRDVGGSVYGCDQLPAEAGAKQFLRPEKYLLTDNCLCRDNWQACVCNDLYGSAQVQPKELWPADAVNFNRSIIAKRVKYSDTTDTAYENHADETSMPRALVVLGDKEYYYEFEHVHGFPKKTRIEIDGVEKDNNVVVGVCLPAGATTSNMVLTGKVGNVKVTPNVLTSGSIQDVRDDLSMETAYLDGRILYLQFATTSVRDLQYDTLRCFDGNCPFYDIEMTEELAYSPCFSPTQAELSTNFMPELANKLTCSYTSEIYGADWGVGDTTASHDGAWSDWSEWSPCDSGSTTRTRLCDSPPPFGSGQDCGTDNSETTSC